jgi:MFS family permease
MTHPMEGPAHRRFPRSVLVPLALAQFVAGFACTNVNVAVTSIARELGTTVTGVQTAITLFTLVAAVLTLPASKLTDVWGRKTCFRIGLIVYGVGAVVAAFAPSLGILVLGFSVLLGVGAALMIPPIYILVTVSSADAATRARGFGVMSAAAGGGVAAGPLIGGVVTTAVSWRGSFLLQFLLIALTVALSRRIAADPARPGAPAPFDYLGAVLSGASLLFVVLGVLQASTYGWLMAKENVTVAGVVIIPKGGISPVWILVAIGALFMLAFLLHARSWERGGRAPLVRLRLFRSRTLNLGLVTQLVQWLILQGSFFVISVFLGTARHYSAIETGLILTPAAIGILVASAISRTLARRRSERFLVRRGFVVTVLGMILLRLLAYSSSDVLTFVPGLLVMGLGIGIMLTASVNVVQSSSPSSEQGDVSGLSRSVSDVGASLGTAIVGSILVASTASGKGPYADALVAMAIFAVMGLVAAVWLPTNPQGAGDGPAE